MDAEIPKRERPHHATITFKIDIREMTPTGEILWQVMGNELLKKYHMSTKGQILVSGATEAHCIKNVKEILERMNG